ncbi:hypothetical protein SBI_06679 [Streptomyces bingchenggensis BCW-1]|uniref:Uncharacterized protein n=1 Tax=Streptomyces bingchenggensis (strain BCW-1) TaxID=749414 RepID=D7BXQ1_STRBB|nr:MULTISPECIES: DUF2017 domain-containing protein [Streptomyces]ADI09799.1 hypothetical protein SBI_06679 [Streptomyces bingchenggensis BCW-1]
MAGHFEPLPGGGAMAALDDVEISILRSLAVQLLELIGPGTEPVEGHDPLDALFAEGPTKPPADPALARLFPDAYGGPGRKLGADEEATAQAASSEFRRYTENDLRARKREDALAVVRGLDALARSGAGAGAGTETGAEAEGAEVEDAEAGGAEAEGPETEGVEAGTGVLELSPEQSRQWLGALNDLRLAIGTRLEVTDEDDGGELLRLPDSDPRKPMVMAYFWLGGLQETLVETLMP